MNYQSRLKLHLAAYKLARLGIKEPGLFRYQGRDVYHAHILPKAQSSANLLAEASRDALSFLETNPRKRHKDFHHLNSSQALAFNLFFAYFGPSVVSLGSNEAVSSSLLRALGQDGRLLCWEPELVPDVDEQSNIDVAWTSVGGAKTFCEVKLSEAEFGRAKDDSDHRNKLERIYRDALEKYLTPDRLEPARFFREYQFNRNLWHMVQTPESRLVFLLPRANSRLWQQLQTLLTGVLPPARARVSAIAIEDVILRLLNDAILPEEFRRYAAELSQKYLFSDIP